MKKIYFALSLIVLVSSCKKGSDALVGSWVVMSHGFSGTETTSTFGQESTSTFVGRFRNGEFRMIFSQDPNQVEMRRDYEEEIETTINGVTTTDITIFNNTDIGSWNLDGDLLAISIDNDTIIYTIQEVAGNQFFMNYTEEDVQINGNTVITRNTSGRYEMRR